MGRTGTADNRWLVATLSALLACLIILGAAPVVRSCPGSALPSPDWVTYHHVPNGHAGVIGGIILDASGDVFHTGFEAVNGRFSWLTAKYSGATGTRLWTSRGSARGAAVNVTLDEEGDAYVTGWVEGEASPGIADAWTVKYDGASGEELWASRYHAPGSTRNDTFRVTTDGEKVYVLGRVFSRTGPTGNVTAHEILVLAYDAATGDLQWEDRYSSGWDGLETFNSAQHLVLDGAGGLYVAGEAYRHGPEPGTIIFDLDWVVLKYATGTGEREWVARYGSDGGDRVNGLQVGEDGVFVTGSSPAQMPAVAGDHDLATASFNRSTGQQQWVRHYDGPANRHDLAEASAIDPAGNVYVTAAIDGLIGTQTPRRVTLKYEGATGDLLWATVLGAGTIDAAHGMVVSPQGMVCLAGVRVLNSARDMAVIGYDTATGALTWSAFFDGPTSGGDEAVGVAIDSSQHVFATGTFNEAAGGTDVGTLRFTVNRQPVANAPGVTATVARDGDPKTNTVAVTLNGATSFDPDGHGIATYEWRSSTGTVLGTAATLSRTLAVGTHTFVLQVTDGLGASGETAVTVQVLPEPNSAPTAHAGPDQAVAPPHDGKPGTNTVTVTLDGSASSDTDGDDIDFAWKDANGDTIASKARHTLTLTPGVRAFTLEVTDVYGAVGADTVVVTIGAEPNGAPVADAGADRIVAPPHDGNPSTQSVSVTLSGGATDPDGDSLTYEWRDAENAAISNTASLNVMLTPGSHTFALRAVDIYGAAGTDTVSVQVDPEPNAAPTADAGPDRTLGVPASAPGGTATVTLNGSASSDPELDDLTFEWRDAGAAVLGTAASLTRTLLVGSHVFTLRVTDAYGASATDEVTVTVSHGANTPPTADAGPDQAFVAGKKGAPVAVTLNASASMDADGDPLTLQWSLGGNPLATGAAPLVRLGAGRHRVTLTVGDGTASATDVMYVTVGVVNVTSSATVTVESFTRQGLTKNYTAQLRIRNTGDGSLPSTLSLAFDNLPKNVSVMGAAGKTSAATAVPIKSPYVDVAVGAGLAPGQSVVVTAQLTSKTVLAAMPGTRRVLAGIGKR